jgi:hypothetical protein
VVSSNATPVVVQSFGTLTNHLYVNALQLGAAGTNLSGGREFFSIDTSFSLWNSNGAALYMMESPSVVMSNKTAGLAAASYDVNFSSTTFRIRFTGVSNMWVNAKAKGQLTDVTPYDFTICTAASISAQPSSVTNITNSTLSFTLTAAGDATLYYQWQRTNDGNATFTNLANNTRFAGVLTNKLWVSNGIVAESAWYQCEVTNACGAITSSVAYASFTNGTAVATTHAWAYASNYNDGSFNNGETGANYDPDDSIYGAVIVITNAGTVTNLAARVVTTNTGATATGVVKLAMYDVATTNLICSGTTLTITNLSAAWTNALCTPTSVSAGTYYLVASASTNSIGYSSKTAGFAPSGTLPYAQFPTNELRTLTASEAISLGFKIYVD